jgi:hypothetical protein
MNFKELLTKADITVKELSYKLCKADMPVYTQLISNWGTGRTKPSIEIIAMLPKILNCSYEEVVNALAVSYKRFRQKAGAKCKK